jgi:hypothetical protein
MNEEVTDINELISVINNIQVYKTSAISIYGFRLNYQHHQGIQASKSLILLHKKTRARCSNQQQSTYSYKQQQDTGKTNGNISLSKHAKQQSVPIGTIFRVCNAAAATFRILSSSNNIGGKQNTLNHTGIRNFSKRGTNTSQVHKSTALAHIYIGNSSISNSNNIQLRFGQHFAQITVERYCMEINKISKVSTET